MKINYIRDVEGFFKEIDKCNGNVWIKTPEGDVLNLKSKITQYVAFVSLFEDAHKVDMELHCDNSEDVIALTKYLIG